MDELMQKFEQISKTFADFKQLNDTRLKAIEQKGYAPADLEEKVQKADKEIERLQGQIKAMETAMARGAHGADNDNKDEKAAQYKEAFRKYASGRITEGEFKAMSVDSDVDGGFTVPEEVSSEVVKKIFESSPVRQLASVQTISTDSLDILQDLDEVGSGWVTETQTRAVTTTPQFKMIKIPVHELYAMPSITQKLLDDSAFNLESWLAAKVSEKFGRDEATAFVSGDGMNKPKGLLTYTAGTSYGQIEQVVSGSAATITADGLIDLQGALKEAYQGNSVWMMKRATVTAVRKLKDSQNRYLWEPGLVPGNPDMLLGKPLYKAEDMPALGANALSVVYGDFKAGYQVVDRVGIRTLRDPFTAKPYILFYTTKRVGGAVKNFEALKIGKCST